MAIGKYLPLLLPTGREEERAAPWGKPQVGSWLLPTGKGRGEAVSPAGGGG